MLLLSLIFGKFQNNISSNVKFAETEPYEIGFSEHYDKNVKHHVASFEKKRLESLHKASFRTRISMVVMVLACIITFIASSNLPNIGDAIELQLTILGLTLAICYWWVHSALNDYKESVKSIIFPNIISFLGDYTYSPKCDERFFLFKDSGIVPNHNLERNEDEIVGEYKGVRMTLFESELRQKSYDKKNNHKKFKGLVLCLSSNKKFSGKTIIRNNNTTKIKNWLFNKSTSDIKAVELEDPLFKKVFEVYSSDQVEARYLLTTTFMERLLQLKTSFNGKKIECSFFNNILLIMISIDDNLFEPAPINETEDFIDDSKKLLSEMNIILQIIDILNLDHKTGL